MRKSDFHCHIPIDDFEGGNTNESQPPDSQIDMNIRLFQIPVINIKAKSFHEIESLNLHDIEQPPAIKHFTDLELESLRSFPLKLEHPCHNQAVERHVKAVTEASAHVTGFECRDGVIRQKLKSQKLMKFFNTNYDFTVLAD